MRVAPGTQQGNWKLKRRDRIDVRIILTLSYENRVRRY
jgi:hypothetical protein